MRPEELASELRRRLPGLRVAEKEPMSAHCAFRIGGPADLFLEPGSESELLEALRFLTEQGETPVIIGNGTNLLVRDEGVRAPVIRIGEALGGIDIDGETVTAGAGASLSRIAAAARDAGLSGFEFAHGIPGGLGGAIVMNAGAYGGEMKDVVISVRYLDETGALRETEDPGFSYRRSRFSGGEGVILGATLRLVPGPAAEIAARMLKLWEKRSSSQPLTKPSAGSTFKRPATGYAAAMIDGAGLKGVQIGGARVSEKHAGFVINTGGATCADVLALMAHIQEAVRRKYGVLLEPEVKLIG